MDSSTKPQYPQCRQELRHIDQKDFLLTGGDRARWEGKRQAFTMKTRHTNTGKQIQSREIAASDWRESMKMFDRIGIQHSADDRRMG